VFKVRAKLSGFQDQEQDVDLRPDADAQVELQLEIDDKDARRGCIANGCRDGRQCDDSSGQCVGCTNNGASCGQGLVCISNVCVPQSGARHLCEPCSDATQCEAPEIAGQTAICAGAPGVGVCSRSCSVPGDCPAGFACSGGACVPPSGCSSYLATFGNVCLDSSVCTPAQLECVKPSGAASGVCTLRCSGNSDCPESLGYKCTAGVCAKQ
jgi:hypothetical protein